MKIISVFVFWVFAALAFLSGCQSDPLKEEVEVEGQVFVVTKGRENIKMGLTPIYVVSDEEFQKIAAELAEEIQAFRVEGIQWEANDEARTKFIRELLAMEGRYLAEPALETLRAEAARPSAEYIVKNRFLVHEDLERSKVLLFSMMPEATTKTDADGKFKISLSSKSWLIAQGQRSVGKESEDYLWIVPSGEPEKASKSSLLISNDSGYDSTEELYALLNSVSASGSDVLPAVGSGEVDQETAQWIRDANEKAKQSIRMAEQAAEAEMKAAEAERVAKLDAIKAEKQARILELATIRDSLSLKVLLGGSRGGVVAWGRNDMGQCDVPTGLTDVAGISAGYAHSLALKKDGTVIAWGLNSYNQSDVPTGLTDVEGIAAGFFHSLALKKDGTVVAWGDNDHKQCDVPTGLRDVVEISTRANYSLALKEDGTVVAWGSNSLGQLDVPASLKDVVGISAGGGHNLALKKDGTVAAWGSNSAGQCDVPARLTDVVGIVAGASHSLVIRKDGTVAAWGSNSAGQCDVPSSLTEVVGIAAGIVHSLALKNDGTVVAWGSNSSDQLNVPGGLIDVVGIFSGSSHNLVIKKISSD